MPCTTMRKILKIINTYIFMFHIYGLIIGIAIVVGWGVAEKFDPEVNKVAPWVLGLGIIGARIWHVVDFWNYYFENLSQVVMLWNGGLSIWGGLIGGLVGLLIYFKGSTHKALKFSGVIVMGLPLAQAIGRLGNAVNGEFVSRVWIFPWWGAEAILDLLLFGIIWMLRKRPPEVRVGAYLFGYGLIRLVLQPYRL